MKKTINTIFIYIFFITFPFLMVCCTDNKTQTSTEKEKKIYDYSELQKTLSNSLQPITKANKFSGIVSVCNDNDEIYNESFYYSPNLNNQTFDSNTKFMIGSLTKQFTAMAILFLSYQGKINLQDNINTYIPNFPWGNVINIHDILTHTSGLPRDPFYEYMVNELNVEISECYIKNIVKEKRHIRDILNQYTYNDRTGIYTIKETTYFNKKSEIMNILFTYCYALDAKYKNGYDLIDDLLNHNQIKIISTPGKTYNYSNLGYIILGYLIQKVTGIPFEKFLQEYFFIPLQMYDTEFGYNPNENSYALGISEYNSVIERDLKLQVWPGAAGGLHSTINDLQKWATFLTNDEIIPYKIKSLLWGQYKKIGYSSYGYGMLTTNRTINGKNITDINHNGFVMSYNSSLHILPKQKIKIVILSNDVRYQYAQENWINRILNIIFSDKTIKSQMSENITPIQQ